MFECKVYHSLSELPSDIEQSMRLAGGLTDVDFQDKSLLVATNNGKIVEARWDGKSNIKEPYFMRDLNWIESLVKSAYKAGVENANASTRQIMQEIHRLSGDWS